MIVLLQGIIAPKIEVSTKTIIEEILEFYDASKCYVINPNISSKVLYFIEQIEIDKHIQ